MSIAKLLWRKWMALAEIIGGFMNRVIMTLLYFTLVVPFGLGARLFSNRLDLTGKGESGWTDFENRTQTVDEARGQ